MMMASPLAAQRVKNPIIRARAPNGSTNEQRGTLEYCFFYLNMVWGVSHIVSLYFNFNLNSIFISHATGWTNKQLAQAESLVEMNMMTDCNNYSASIECHVNCDWSKPDI
jgi:hypothetical protein